MRRFLVGLCAALVACQNSEKTVSLILPVEAPAILSIQEGFEATLKQSHPDYKILIKKGLGDDKIKEEDENIIKMMKVCLDVNE